MSLEIVTGLIGLAVGAMIGARWTRAETEFWRDQSQDWRNAFWDAVRRAAQKPKDDADWWKE